MSVKVEKLEGNKVKLEFVVEKEKFVQAIDSVIKENAKYFMVPGFRKGKVPADMVKRYYGMQTFYSDAFDKIANDVYPKAVEENNLKVVSKPDVDVVTMSTEEDLVFNITVDVEPEVKLGKYKGIELEKVEYKVTEDDIEERLNQMAEQNARITTNNEKELEKGDISVIDFEGFKDDVPFDGGKAEGHELEIGSGAFIPGFEDQLIGMKVGEEKDINVTFPEDYHVEDLKGQPVVFKVKLHEIKVKELPAIDDELAKDVSEFETLEELKNDIKEKMEQENEERAKGEIEAKALEIVRENTDIDIPHSMIETEVDNKIHEIEHSMKHQGITLEQYLMFSGMKMDDFRIELEEGAKNDVKTRLILEAIIKEENVEVNDEDVDNKIANMAKKHNRDLEEYKKTFSESHKQYFKENLKYEKAIDVIISNVKYK